MLGFLQGFWWFLVLIGVMILLHELGHYLVARLFDVHIEAFSFGFGPRLFGFKRGETDFRFCAFLLGGYVKMAGEQPGEAGGSSSDGQVIDPRAFPAKPRWQRLLIIFAGPAVNMVLAVGILAGLFMYQYPRQTDPPNPIVAGVTANGPAAQAGMQEGDQILQFDGDTAPTRESIWRKEVVGVGRPMLVSVLRNGQRVELKVTPAIVNAQEGGTIGWTPHVDVQLAGPCCGVDAIAKAGLKSGDIFISANGKAIHSPGALIEIVEKSAGSPLHVIYARSGQQQEATITPAWTKEDGGHWRMGAALQSPVEIVKLPFREAVGVSIEENKKSAMMFYQLLRSIIEQRMSPKLIDGPIGIAVESGRAAKEGPVRYLMLMAAISLNLAVVNLLPIPLLDGGGILMLLIEMLMRRDMSMNVKEAVVKVGFAFLMMVVVFVIYNDISKLLTRG